MADIASELGCSLNKVKYWMTRYDIKIRSISDAIYLKNNPNGDPFKENKPSNFQEAYLRGLGIGLYWGEGTKANKTSVRLGNSDPALINQFIQFLEECYGVKKSDLRFGLQVFSDMEPNKVLMFWTKKIGAAKNQFQKIIITPSRGDGTYRRRTRYGVLTVYYYNRKLRDLLCMELKSLGFCD